MNDGTKLLLPGLMNDGRVWQNQLPVLRPAIARSWWRRPAR